LKKSVIFLWTLPDTKDRSR